MKDFLFVWWLWELVKSSKKAGCATIWQITKKQKDDSTYIKQEKRRGFRPFNSLWPPFWLILNKKQEIKFSCFLFFTPPQPRHPPFSCRFGKIKNLVKPRLNEVLFKYLFFLLILESLRKNFGFW
jgi:hypothetical protein